jgi:hypothetical protein
LLRYSLRLVPSFGICRLSWKGSQRTLTGRPKQRRTFPSACGRCSTTDRSRPKSRQQPGS